MKKHITIILLLLISFTYGQTQIVKSCISTGGGSAVSGNTEVSYALGEVAVQEESQGPTTISEGFIGPDVSATFNIDKLHKLTGVSLYPNPAHSFVKINFRNQDYYAISIFNSEGKMIFFNETAMPSYLISLKNYQIGEYVIIITNLKSKNYTVFKLIIN